LTPGVYAPGFFDSLRTKYRDGVRELAQATQGAEDFQELHQTDFSRAFKVLIAA
jgi:hypothetical protein